MSKQNSAAVSHGSHHKQDASFARSKGGLIKQNNQTLIGIGENTEKFKKKTTSKSMIQSMSKTLSRTIKTIKKLKSGHTLIHAYISKNIFPRV